VDVLKVLLPATQCQRPWRPVKPTVSRQTQQLVDRGSVWAGGSMYLIPVSRHRSGVCDPTAKQITGGVSESAEGTEEP
jgi:hypothetical protein